MRALPLLATVYAAGVAIAVPLSDCVDLRIGTAANGHCHVAASFPFGMVQAGPDTGNAGWAYCGGYRDEDRRILGFSQTHISGTGCMDLGDLLVMPFAGPPGAARTDFSSEFLKETERMSPGFYSVFLEGPRTEVEIAAAPHSAIYSFAPRDGDECETLSILVDCQYGIGGNPTNQILSADVRQTGPASLAGTVCRSCWVDRAYSFVVEFSRPFAALERLPARAATERGPRFAATFRVPDGERLFMKLALSSKDREGASRNLAAEIPAWDFAGVRDAARTAWSGLIDRMELDASAAQSTNAATALYHLFLQPNNIADVGEKPFYSTFSTWDTFRAAHPLYTIIAPEKAAEFVDSMLEQGRRTGFLPIWSLWGKDNQCMVGTHSVPVIVDWFLKAGNGEGRSGRDYWEKAYAQVRDTLTKPHEGRRKERWDLLDAYGWYPCDVVESESASRTLECAYDDACAAKFAAALGMSEDAAFFYRRAANWTNVFDRALGFARAKDSRGAWREPFSPFSFGYGTGQPADFTEGNSWQYTWHVMHDVEGLITEMGGGKAFVAQLDRLFSLPEKVEGQGSVGDVSGPIGQYAHGNEPGHHTVYLYALAGRRDRTAELVREICDRLYRPTPDGLCGNEDCGQMSAWYLFSIMGFYPVDPCGGEYVLGAPQVTRARLKVGNAKSKAGDGKGFSIIARNLSEGNKYAKAATLNGEPVRGWKVSHVDIVRGGELVFTLDGGK